MESTLIPGIASALVYTLTGLGVFAAAVVVIRRTLATDSLPQTLLAMAATLGAAIIIAATMH